MGRLGYDLNPIMSDQHYVTSGWATWVTITFWTLSNCVIALFQGLWKAPISFWQ